MVVDRGCRDVLSYFRVSNGSVGREREEKWGDGVVVVAVADAETVGIAVVGAFAVEVVVKALWEESKELRVQSPDLTVAFVLLLLLLVSKKLTKLKSKKKLPREESWSFRSR